MNSVDKIRLSCHKILAIPTLLPNKSTYCNIGTFLILRELKLHNDFIKNNSIMLANEMYDVLKTRYKQISLDEVFTELETGKVFVASIKEQPHGHIAIIYPHRTRIYSSKWNKFVPLCANFGVENGIMGLNWAFNKEPELFEIGFVE